MDRQTDELIRVGLANLRFLQVNTHDELPVDALLECPMQGLHFESLWMGMLCGATPLLIDTIVRKSLVKVLLRRV
jgi:hypothetical protein